MKSTRTSPNPLRVLGPAAVALAIVFGTPHDGRAVTALPADVGIYGQQPATFRDGITPFPPSGTAFDYQQDSNDPVTRLKFRAVPGLRNGLGRFTHRLTAFGKYILLGSAPANWAGGTPADTSIGVFDSEAKTFCSLALSATVGTTVPQLVTANPNGRQSRIVLAPGTTPSLGGSAAFGYVLADLNAADPCTWPSVTVSAAQLNAGFAPADQLCPNNFCAFDTFALLGHQDVQGDPYGRDYVAIGEYFKGHDVVVRIDSGGVAIVALYTVPLFATPGSGGACYTGAPARLPTADFQLPDARPASDWRFAFSYDSYLQDVYPSPPPASCATPYPYCPLDVASDGLPGAACPGSGTCAQKYCTTANPFAGGYQPCATDSDCSNPNLGSCQSTCLLKSPLFTCSANGSGSHRQCLSLQPSTCPSGESCSSGLPSIVGPSQEYRFDSTTNTITPTSPMFFPASTNGLPTGITPSGVVYGTDRSVWLLGSDKKLNVYLTKAATDACTVAGQTVHVSAGEHCYYSASPDPSTGVVVASDEALSFEVTPSGNYIATTAQIGSAMYVADPGSLQYAQSFAGAWFPVADTAYKVGFAYDPPYVPITDPSAKTSLPAEPRQCSGSLAGCNTNADCPSGQTCVALGEAAVSVNAGFLAGIRFLQDGGAPRSLWVPSGYVQTNVHIEQTDEFLLRIPVGVNLTANTSAVRPSIAWSGDRLWLVSEQNGELQYRVRDAGVWSSWYSLAPNNVTMTGGPAVIANGTTVMMFAHDASGAVYAKSLTSAETCAAGSCTWSTWSALPTAITTNDDVAAAFAGTTPLVAVHATNDGVYAITRGASWGTWFRVGALMATNAAPSVAYHPADGRVWIAALLRSSSAPMYSRINPVTLAWDSWTGLPTSGAPTPRSAPGIVSDGAVVRAFVPQQASPNQTWETANDGSGWSAWRPVLGGAGATRQPAGASINGDIDLVTYWFTNGMQEEYVP